MKFTQAPTILLHPGQISGRSFYRILNPAAKLQLAGYARSILHFKFLDSDTLKKINPDVVVFDTQHTDEHLETLRRYRQVLKNAFLVYEIDDLFTEVPKSSVHAANIPKDIKNRLRIAMNLCDCITTTTEPLAEYWRSELGIRDVRILPNMIPAEIFDEFEKQPVKKNEKLRVGWAGGVSHTGDLRFIKEVVEKVGDKVQWVFMGMMPEGLDPKLVEFHKPVEIQDYMPTLKSLNLDIGIAPLEDNRFNDCKSNLRMLEYGACGFAAIASDAKPYRDAPAVLLKNNVDEWVSEILKTADQYKANPDLLQVCKDGLRLWVKNNYCLDNYLIPRMRGWLRQGAEIFNPDAEPFEDFLYVRPGVILTEDQKQRILTAKYDDNVASVSFISNDGGFLSYPAANHFNPMIKEHAGNIDKIVSCETRQTIDIHRAAGPCVLMRARALSRVGSPSEDYNQEENSIMDWCCRALEQGCRHVVDTSVFASVTLPGEATADKGDVEKIQLRFPFAIENEKKGIEVDPLNKVREQIDLGFFGAHYQPTPPKQGTYQEWVEQFDTLDYDQKKRFSFIPDPEFMKVYTSIQDVRNDKEIPKWIVLASPNVVLAENALYEINKHIEAHSETMLLYSDCDRIDKNGVRFDPYFKPNFDYELFLNYNYMSGMVILKGDCFPAEGDGEYEIILNCFKFIFRHLSNNAFSYSSEAEARIGRIVHIPHILYHFKTIEPVDFEIQRKVVENYLNATDQPAKVVPNSKFDHIYEIKFERKYNPLVSIIIPTTGDLKILNPCLNTLFAMTDYPEFEVLLMVNNSSSKDTAKWINSVNNPKIRIIKYDTFPFNFSETVNFGVKSAKGEYVLLLNDDTQFVDKRWLSEMVGIAMRDGVGSVGAKLLYPNGNIQHSGDMKIEHGAVHILHNKPMDTSEHFGYAQMNHEVHSCTASCLLINKHIYEVMGGFDGKKYPIYFNDVDFGIRLYKSGYRNVVAANAIVVHNESTSLSKNPEKKLKSLRYSVNFLNEDHPDPDPYLNSNLQPNGQFNSLIWNPKTKVEYRSGKENVLVVNPLNDDFRKRYAQYNVFMALTTGPLMKIFEPNMPNVYPWDTRAHLDMAKSSIQKLNIKKIIFCSLGDGVVEILSFITRLGLPVEYAMLTDESVCPKMMTKNCKDYDGNPNIPICQKCIDDQGSKFGFVDMTGWKSTWDRFLNSKNVVFAKP